MPKNRMNMRKIVAQSKKEKPLDSKNMFGVADPTPKEAVRNIREEARVAQGWSW